MKCGKLSDKTFFMCKLLNFISSQWSLIINELMNAIANEIRIFVN
jgi:hypothetical protein